MPSQIEPFKQCPCCSLSWKTRDAFMSDGLLKLNGYKADFESLDYGLFLFTHLVPDCGSTMALEVAAFSDLYAGPRYSERRTGEADCPGYCLEQDELKRCDAFCECAFAREISHLLAASK